MAMMYNGVYVYMLWDCYLWFVGYQRIGGIFEISRGSVCTQISLRKHFADCVVVKHEIDFVYVYLMSMCLHRK